MSVATTDAAQPAALGEPLALTLWREHDEEVLGLGLPALSMGRRDALAANGDGEHGETDGADDPAALVEGLFRDGLRRAAFSRPVDLTGGMDEPTLVRAMLLLRELTSWGIAVDWRLRPGEHTEVWRRLNHLYPPAELIGQPDAQEALDTWRETFYLCKCVYRRGPGFIEVRDRRNGTLSRFVIDDPAYLAAVEALIGGAPAASVPAGILADFTAEGLAGVAGGSAWWLPYRVRRWPWPSMIV
jgi:hypothetical protein